VKEYVLVSECEEILPDSEFDSDSELNDCALLDVVVNGNIDGDDHDKDIL
jgi:hypothetical protein